VPHCSSYVWWYGALYNGVDGHPGESGFRRGVVARPCARPGAASRVAVVE
jgi:hypothetical protein